MHFFDVNTIFFTFLGYKMSYLEFFGTIFNIIAVIYAVRNNILTWWSTLIAVTLFFFLFYQVQLYSDMFIQIFYFASGIAGLITWSKHKEGKQTKLRPITRNSRNQNIAVVAGLLLGTLVWGTFMRHVHQILPGLFPKPAAYAYIDAALAISAIVAQLLLIWRKYENWILWILLDIVAIGVYWRRGVKFVSILYVIFLVLSVLGLLEWRKQLAAEPAKATPQES